MRRYYQVAGFLVLALAVYVMVESRTNLNYYTEWGPGPGFLPFWCAVFLAGFSLAWLVQVSFRPVEAMAKALAGTLIKATFLRPFTDCVVTAGGLTLKVQVPGALAARRGERVYLTVEPDACTLLPGPARAKPLTSPTGS